MYLPWVLFAFKVVISGAGLMELIGKEQNSETLIYIANERKQRIIFFSIN